jgi:hypothetical protein
VQAREDKDPQGGSVSRGNEGEQGSMGRTMERSKGQLLGGSTCSCLLRCALLLATTCLQGVQGCPLIWRLSG